MRKIFCAMLTIVVVLGTIQFYIKPIDAVEKKKVVIETTINSPFYLQMRDRAIKVLADEGFIDKKNIDIIKINLEGDFGKCPQYVEEIKAMKPDVVISDCIGSAPDFFVKPLEKTGIPIIMAAQVDKFVDSQGRPLGNITGIRTFPNDIQKNAFRLLNTFAPNNTKKAVFITLPGLFNREDTEKALKSNGIALVDYKETKYYDEYQAFVTRYNKDQEIGWILYGGTPWSVTTDGRAVQRSEFIQWDIANNKKPNIGYWESSVQNFMMAGLAVDMVTTAEQSAEMAVKILKGQPVKEIGAERPKKVTICLNQKRLKDQGIEVSADILGAAYRVYTDYQGHYVGQK